MAKASPRQRKFKVNIEGYDQIEIASIDSFPASDPPGWIEVKAHPSFDVDTSGKKERLRGASKAAKRATSR